MLAGVAAQPSQTGTTCARATDFTDVTFPQTADPSSLIAIARKTASDQDGATLPSSIISYLDSLPEVQQQFNDIPLFSCPVLQRQSGICTQVVSSTSKQCTTSTHGNLTRTSCTERALTSVITKTPYVESATLGTGPILVSRNPAAYLTYNTLSLSSEPSGLPVNFSPDVIASPTYPQDHESEYICPFDYERDFG
jgi:hypothetical protein